MRLDKYLATAWLLSRKQSTRYIRRGGFFINDQEVFDCRFPVQEWDILVYGEITHRILRNVTLRLWKPAWYVSSDYPVGIYPSYKEMLADCEYSHMVHVAWRLDVDTEWLLIVTSDGQLNHQIISPKWKKEKEYHVTVRDPLTQAQLDALEAGVVLDDGYQTLPARAVQLAEHQLSLILTEWKFHQVKRMLETVWNLVTHLKRIRVWDWTLDGLAPWTWALVE